PSRALPERGDEFRRLVRGGVDNPDFEVVGDNRKAFTSEAELDKMDWPLEFNLAQLCPRRCLPQGQFVAGELRKMVGGGCHRVDFVKPSDLLFARNVEKPHHSARAADKDRKPVTLLVVGSKRLLAGRKRDGCNLLRRVQRKQTDLIGS